MQILVDADACPVKHIKVKIVESQGVLLDEVEKLVAKVFPLRDIPERMSFWVYRRQNNPIVRMLMRIGGVSSIPNIWAAINSDGNVCGTTGLYVYKKDEHEAMWLSWYCVDPKQRGQGIGKMLIEFSIEKAKECSKDFLRLYTSDHPSEAAAQGLYEKYGFVVFKKEKYGSDTYLYRELDLKNQKGIGR